MVNTKGNCTDFTHQSLFSGFNEYNSIWREGNIQKRCAFKELRFKAGLKCSISEYSLLYNDEALFFSVFCCLRFRQSKARFSLFLTAESEAVLE